MSNFNYNQLITGINDVLGQYDLELHVIRESEDGVIARLKNDDDPDFEDDVSIEYVGSYNGRPIVHVQYDDAEMSVFVSPIPAAIAGMLYAGFP